MHLLRINYRNSYHPRTYQKSSITALQKVPSQPVLSPPHPCCPEGWPLLFFSTVSYFCLLPTFI